MLRRAIGVRRANASHLKYSIYLLVYFTCITAISRLCEAEAANFVAVCEGGRELLLLTGVGKVLDGPEVE